MRVVVDTNVFASAALKQSSWPGAVIRWLDKFGGLLKTTVTEAQVIEVLQRPYLAPLIAPAAHAWLKNLLATAEAVMISERIVACRDPTDDKFLEPAVNGRADLIVSGDADLLALNPFRGIPVVSPVGFVQGGSL
ncbi:MAG: putative toxin-antitoxin system toxin component, PIN family [Opitutales bacterium]